MAAGNVVIYTQAIYNIGRGTFNLSTNTFVCLLCTNSYVPQPDTDHLYSDVSATELATGGGYTVGGVVLGSDSWVVSAAASTFTAGNVSWQSLTAGPFRYGVVARRAGAAVLTAGDMLLCYCDLTGGGTITGTGLPFAINWNASGIFSITHSS